MMQLSGMPMMGDAGIQIVKVSNGWMVIMPQQMPMGMPSSYEDALRNQARIMKEEFHGDDLLGKIKANNEAKEAPKPQHPKVDNIHIFTKLKDALSFIEFQVEE